MIGILVSRADEASIRIGEQLLDSLEWRTEVDTDRPDAEGGGTFYACEGFELREFEGLHIDLEGADDAYDDPDCLVIVSRHAGETGPLLTAHFTGNFGPAEFGGASGEFARACPNAHRVALEALSRHAPPDYDVGIECTHHGPSDLEVPSMFVELGSAEPQWRDPAGALAVARAVVELRGVDPGSDRTVLGFGGGHYAPRFERILRETNWALGHIAADWCLDVMEDPAAVLPRAFEASDTDLAVLDGAHPALSARLEELGFREVSETWLRETDNVPRDVVDRLETEVATVAEGLRFGRQAISASTADDFAVYEPDPELLAALHGIDPERARSAVAQRTLAFETEESGQRVSGRLVLPDQSVVDRLVEDFRTLLLEKFETVERTDGALVATHTAFDPELARQRGVPEGPDFGRLAAGDPVETDAGIVRPADVHAERTTRFRL